MERCIIDEAEVHVLQASPDESDTVCYFPKRCASDPLPTELLTASLELSPDDQAPSSLSFSLSLKICVFPIGAVDEDQWFAALSIIVWSGTVAMIPTGLALRTNTSQSLVNKESTSSRA